MAESLGEKLETVLVVDDTNIVLKVVVTILKTAIFNVLHANSWPRRLKKLAANYAGRINSPRSEVTMPGMSHPALDETYAWPRLFSSLVLSSKANYRFGI
jgi:CheY-like chemotaxis protein